MTVNINFGGFYESIHDTILEEAVCNYFGFVDEETGEIESDNIFDIDSSIWKYVQTEYSKSYVEYLNDVIGLDLVFGGVASPKYYNYITDVIVADFSNKDILTLFKYIKSNNLKKEVYELIDIKSTSYDGYLSFFKAEEYFKKENLSLLVECMVDAVLRNEGNPYLECFYIYQLPETVTSDTGRISLAETNE